MKKGKVPVFEVPDEALQVLRSFADSENKSLSQVLREAAQEYLDRRGITVDFSVGSWGGDRRTPTAPEVDDESEQR